MLRDSSGQARSDLPSMRTKDITYAAFIVFPVAIYVGFALSWMGVPGIRTDWLHIMMVAFHAMLCLFLMIRFHPWSKVQLTTSHDSSIIFGAAVLLLTNVVFLEITSYLPAIPKSVSKLQNHIEKSIA